MSEIEILVCFGPENICYVTNGFNAMRYTPPTIAILTLGMPVPYLLVSNDLKVKAEKTPGERTTLSYGGTTDAVNEPAYWQDALDAIFKKVLKSLHTTAGVESDLRSDYRDDLGRLLPQAEFRDASRVLDSCRNIKEQTEIDNVQKAARIGRVGIDAAARSLSNGSSEHLSVLAAEIAMSDCWGSEYPGDRATGFGSSQGGGIVVAFQCVVLADVRRFLEIDSPTDYVPRDKTAEIQITAAVNHYHAKLTRSLNLGNGEKLEVQLKRDLERIYTIARTMLTPGATFNMVYWRIKDLCKPRGYETPTQVGHMIGLGVHEGGLLDATTATEFRPGMIIVLDVAISLGRARARRADTFLVTANGCTCLTE